MKLNKKEVVGIQIVQVLKSQADRLWTATELADSVGSTKAFVEQVTNRLRKAGLVVTQRGPRGGYRLENQNRVTAHDVSSALDVEFNLNTDVPLVNRLQEEVARVYGNTEIM